MSGNQQERASPAQRTRDGGYDDDGKILVISAQGMAPVYAQLVELEAKDGRRREVVDDFDMELDFIEKLANCVFRTNYGERIDAAIPAAEFSTKTVN